MAPAGKAWVRELRRRCNSTHFTGLRSENDKNVFSGDVSIGEMESFVKGIKIGNIV